MQRLSIISTINFILITSLASAASQADLETLYSSLKTGTAETKEGLTAAEREALLKATVENPVAKLSQVAHYDPEGYIGFCYGRAMTAHLLAKKMGLKESSIKKLFIMGDLRSGADPEWRFHVTTLVRGSENGKLYSIDPILRTQGVAKPLAVEQWISRVKSTWDKQDKAHLYLVDSDTIMPDMSTYAKTPENENGERIIDLIFHPEDQVGFSAGLFDQFDFSDVDNLAQETFFSRVGESQAPFDFFGFDMNILDGTEVRHKRFDYRNYFADLLMDLEGEMAPAPELQIEIHPSALFLRGLFNEPQAAGLGLNVGKLGGL